MQQYIKRVLQLPKIEGRTFVVGDIHGELDILHNLLHEYGFDYKNERVVAVGDLIDRGPKSAQCVELLNEPWFFSALGNHDYFLIDAANNDDFNELLFWMAKNGGLWALHHAGLNANDFEGASNEKSIALLNQVRTALIPLSETMKKRMALGIEFESRDGRKIGVCHAGVPGYNWSRLYHVNLDNLNEENSVIWMRDQIQSGSIRHVHGVDEVCHGHTIVSEPLALGNRHYIDIGACRFGNLGFKIY
jgi:serine/threonine protein phosphatase 1